jgi:hypothetical protein
LLSADRSQTGLSIDEQSALYSDLEKELKDIQARQRFMDTGYVEKLEHRMLLDRALNELMGAAPERMALDEAALGTPEDVEGGVMRGMQEQGTVRITWGMVDVEKLEAFDRLLETLHPKPYTLNPKPYTPNPEPRTLHPTP